MHYLLFYEYTSDYLERRGQFRAEHLRLAWAAHERGEVVMGGAFADPADGAAILLSCGSAQAAQEVARKFVEADPYYRNGLISRWYLRSWTTVVGDLAATPVKADPNG